MTKINNPVGVLNLIKKLSEQLKKAQSFEEAAQTYNNLFFGEFQESVILSRTFATIPFEDLPHENKQFVKNLAAKTNVTNLLNDRTSVLTLLGTKGTDASWNSRKTSKGHIGIPLISSSFIDEIPMMAQLLKEIGLDLEWIDGKDSDIVAKMDKKISGVFYVEDAKTAVDSRNRKIIAAQDFVSNYGVNTVFGLGGGYVQSSVFTANINFLKDTVDKTSIERFVPVFNQFKIETMDIVWGKRIFA